MDRRKFLSSAGVVSAASLISAETLSGNQVGRGEPDLNQKTGSWFDPARCWHFFDLWHLDKADRVRLRQGSPVWQPDATFTDSPIGNLSSWPTVYRDQPTGKWRMHYSADWKPYRLMIAESEDGRRWHALPQPAIQPEGEKIASHHLFTLPDGSGGGVYLDPIAEDGYPFKVFVHQKGDAVYRRAVSDPKNRWHSLAQKAGVKRYLSDEFTLVSRDGIHWDARHDLAWSKPDWHPEPPIFAYYDRKSRQHAMTVRPGWGDRRQCRQSTNNFRDWSGPNLLLQPDFLDDQLVEFYGMPVFPYGDGYVGLLWVFHCQSTTPTRGFNRFVGPVDCHLTYSHDGVRFDRASREPLIGIGELGSPLGGAVQPSCMVELEEEIRIYSSASRVHHGRGSDARRRGVDAASITLHTLRKDGLTFLECDGDQGRLLSKPIVLLSPELTVNAAAPQGNITFQLTDIESRPVEGFTFDDSRPLESADSNRFELRWASNDLNEVVGKIVRLEINLRHARLYALRGRFHFIDAHDRSLIQDGQPIVT